jgi:hypothetical protein
LRGWSHEQSNAVSNRSAGTRRAHGLEHEREYDSQWAAISSISGKLGMTARLAMRALSFWRESNWQDVGVLMDVGVRPGWGCR